MAGIETWSRCRVHGTWTDALGSRLQGTYEATITGRVTNRAMDSGAGDTGVIIPAGRYASGILNINDLAKPSLDIDLPATDDIDIPDAGWAVILTVRVRGDKETVETYTLRALPSDGDINLVSVLPDKQTAVLVGPAGLKIGIAGGVPLLSSRGYVMDANGNEIITTTDANSLPISDVDLSALITN